MGGAGRLSAENCQWQLVRSAARIPRRAAIRLIAVGLSADDGGQPPSHVTSRYVVGVSKWLGAKRSQQAMKSAAITGPMTKPVSPNMDIPPRVEISTT